MDTTIKRAEPVATSTWVRSPAGRSPLLRSRPMRPPRKAARRIRKVIWASISFSMVSTSNYGLQKAARVANRVLCSVESNGRLSCP